MQGTAPCKVCLAWRLQSMMNTAAWLIFVSSKLWPHHTAPMPITLAESSIWRIDYKLAVLVYKCLHDLAPSYLADELHYPAESELLKASAFRFVSWTIYSPYRTFNLYSNQAFPVAAVRIWNSLPQHITSAPSLPVFCSRVFYPPPWRCEAFDIAPARCFTTEKLYIDLINVRSLNFENTSNITIVTLLLQPSLLLHFEFVV